MFLRDMAEQSWKKSDYQTLNIETAIVFTQEIKYITPYISYMNLGISVLIFKSICVTVLLFSHFSQERYSKNS